MHCLSDGGKKPWKKKQTAFREQSSHFGELPSSELSRTPFLTRTRKRIIATDAENEKMFDSNVLLVHTRREKNNLKLWRTQSREWVVSQLSVRRDSAWSPAVCVIMSSSSVCPVSGAPLWPYASLLLSTLNGHRHVSTHTQFWKSVYLQKPIFSSQSPPEAAAATH